MSDKYLKVEVASISKINDVAPKEDSTREVPFFSKISWLNPHDWKKLIEETFIEMNELCNKRIEQHKNFDPYQAKKEEVLMGNNWLVRKQTKDEFDDYFNQNLYTKDQEFDQNYWLIRQNFWQNLHVKTSRGKLTRKDMIKEWCSVWLKTEITLTHKRVYDYWLGELSITDNED